MKYTEIKELLRQDYYRISHCSNSTMIDWLKHAFSNPVWGVILCNRLQYCNNLYYGGRRLVEKYKKHCEYKTGIQISKVGTYCNIAGGLRFPHFSCIIINGSAVIGRNCTIYQGVTIGSVRGKGVPTIGNNCILFANAQVIGDVKIGDNVVVGAGALVIKDIPNNCVVAGVPAKVISNDSSLILEQYK